MVTIEKLLKDGIEIIKKRDFNNPFLDVQLIMSYLLKKDRTYLHLHMDEVVDEDISSKFYEMVEKRNTGYPLQYMLNSQEFMGIEIYVCEGVLVPRPDTEILVEKVIKIANERFKNKTVRILDIGTGSGAIAVSLAYYLKNSIVTAIDISDIAVEAATNNKNKYKLENLFIYKKDIFSDFDINEEFDIVVSNPPYIERDTIRSLPLEVSLFEPKLALDGGIDGLDYYKKIVEVFKDISLQNSVLAVEIGYNQKKKVIDIFNNLNKFNKIECYKDYSGNDRVIIGFL